MSAAGDPKAAFLGLLTEALANGTFVRLTLGKFRGAGESRKAVATLILLKGAPHLKIVTSLARKDDTKTYSVPDGIRRIGELVGADYQSTTLFARDRDVTLSYNRKGEPRLQTSKPTAKAAEAGAHDRAKSYLVPADRPYLRALGVADGEGRIKPTMQGKYRQICRYIEIADQLIGEAGLRAGPLSLVDIGSGKGYLTFALYDHLTQGGADCQMTGVDVQSDLVEAGSRLARELGFLGLVFELSEARHASANAVDVVIALHACDTATDDAMAFGIGVGAKLILAAPCCQHELAPQLKETAEGLAGLIKYPLFRQRQADLVTDAARALLLEASGYKVKVIEFVSSEHTSKNILIAAVKSASVDREMARRQYRALKREAGFSSQHLASQLKDVE